MLTADATPDHSNDVTSKMCRIRPVTLGLDTASDNLYMSDVSDSG